MCLSKAHAEPIQFPVLAQALSPSVLPKKLVCFYPVTPLIQKITQHCSNQGVSQPKGPPSQQKY